MYYIKVNRYVFGFHAQSYAFTHLQLHTYVCMYARINIEM